jgi:alkylhydroperoxidase family enzyme
VLADRITLDWRRAGLDALRAEGLTDAECWDVAEIAAMYNVTNRMAMATDLLPNPEYHALAR